MVDSAKRKGAGRRSERAGTGSPAVEEAASDLSRAAPRSQGDPVRSVVALVGANSIGAVLGAAGGLLVARFLDPETVGSFRAYTIPLMFMVFLHLGTFDGLQRQVPFFLGKGQRDSVEAAVSAAGAWNLVLSIVVSGAFASLGVWRLAHGDVQGALGWGSQAVVTWAVYYGGFLGATYRTVHHFVAAARVQAVQALLSFLLVFALPFLGFLGLCIRSAAPAGLGALLLHRWRPMRIPPSLKGRPLAELIRFGLPFCLWGSLYTSIWNAVESSMMLVLGGVKGLGLFAVAFMLREGICIIPQALNQVMAPRVAHAYGKDGRLRNALALTYRVALPVTLGMVLVVLLLSVLLDAVVPTLLPRYAEGLGLMKLILWFGVVQAAGLPLTALFASGRSWRHGSGILAGALVFPLVAYLLAPAIGGMMAVAGGSLAGKVVRTVAGYWELGRLTAEEGR